MNTPSQKPNRIAIIGNVAGGKTRLARKLAQTFQLPLLHIDSIQFLPGMKIRPLNETRSAIKTFCEQERWIVDGYGPLDLLESRLKAADLIVLVDLPLWRHYYWCIRRQFRSIWKPREELPAGCTELTWSHTKKLLRTINEMHSKMRPELLRILSREIYRGKTVTIKSVRDLNQF